jgi:mono/diheme cytochrome c family protein
MVAQGQQIFTGAGLCYTCHGPDGTGTPLAPNLTDVTWINVDGSYDAIVGVVTSGVAQPREHPAPMPPLGGAQLTPEQVRAVAAYVYSRAHGG